MRAGFASLLEREPDLTVVAEASDGEEALRGIEKLRPMAAPPTGIAPASWTGSRSARSRAS